MQISEGFFGPSIAFFFSRMMKIRVQFIRVLVVSAGLVLCAGRCAVVDSNKAQTSGLNINLDGTADSGFYGDSSHNLKMQFEPMCSSLYADSDHVGTTLEEAPGLAIQVYQVASINNVDPLSSVLANRVPFRPILNAAKLKAYLLANNALDLPLGNLPDGIYFLSLCSSSDQFQDSCSYQPGESILSRLVSIRPDGTGILLVASRASAPVFVKVAAGKPSLIQFDIAKGFYNMPVLVSNASCGN